LRSPTPAPPPAPAAPPLKPRVKLVVLVMFDQMRGDDLDKWRPQFGPDGFARLQTQGAWFARCDYPYATTTTGPGHASVLTGTTPSRHGIVNNNWNEHGKDVYCAASERYALVPPQPPETDPKTGKEVKAKTAGNPDRLLTDTLADVLRRVFGEAAKVFGLSLKDRSAIFPTGKRPTGAFWFTTRFVTSTYYTDHLDRRFPEWVTQFNQSHLSDRWFARDWTRFRPDLDYAALSGSDNGPGEGAGTKQGKTFPHPTTGGLKAPGKAYYEALANSPFGNEMLLEFAKTCVTEEKLGADDVPDLLTVSFSSNDLIGHTWGPDSQEVLDVTLRSDAIMADLLGFLDRTVGRDNYALALTADHGVCPLPESPAGQARGAKRVDLTALQAGMEKHLAATFGDPNPNPAADPKAKKTGWIEAVSAPWVYLNPRLVAASGKTRDDVARSLAGYLEMHPDVARAFTRADLDPATPPPADPVNRQVRKSYYPERSGDVYLLLPPFDLPGKAGTTGTTHGTPYGYDTWVPLIAYGPGISGGRREERVTPQAAAAILARFAGVPAPADDYPVPATLGAP
ncbi:MAG TPA: alkaline phosphatase family protein, partial [Urbifossiella sp.]|nr:alkaline phosphatase family protein [Urbifossiella sp.]